jgi:hypothetical protein
MDALNSQAMNLNIDSCAVRRDVIDAILRQPFTTATVPYANINIPGYVFATEYDMGKNGFAYGDKDFQNISGNSGGGVWNSGGIYRNDGVDIERCSDFPTNGYDVSGINNGEFLTFTINASETTTYDLSVRYSANAAGSMLRLFMDGNYDSGILTLPSTNNLLTWSSFSAGQYSFTAGPHLFGISLLSSGFNLNFIKFTNVNGHNQDTSDYQLQQNYPNPFYSTTVIKYQLPGTGKRFIVSLKVFDVLGREVANLINEQQEAGPHQTIMDARRLASGVYVYRLLATDEQNDKHTLQKKMLLLK